MNTLDRIILSNVVVWYISMVSLILLAALMLIPSFTSNVWKYGGNTATLMLKLNAKELKAYGNMLLPFQQDYPILETYKRVRAHHKDQKD